MTPAATMICSICLIYPTNHVCSFDIAKDNKQCGIPVCSMCKTDKLGMEDTAPYRCRQHAPSPSSSSSSTSSSFQMSGITTCASATSTSMKRKNDAITDTQGPKYKIDDHKSLRKKSFLWKFYAPFNIAFHPEMKQHRICLICRGLGMDKALKVGEKCSTGNLITHLCTHPQENEEYMKATAEAAIVEKEEESDLFP